MVSGTHGDRTRARVQRTTRQTIRMTFVIVSAFVCCWTPFAILELVDIINAPFYLSISAYVKDFVYVVALGNSCINPLIYGTHINVLKTAWRRYRRQP